MLGLNLSLGLASNLQVRNDVARMVAAIRQLGGSLWMVDNSYAGAYVDITGVTPVTAVGDLLGLMTDRSYGSANLGPVVQTLASTWSSLGTGFALSGGVMTLTSSATGRYALKGVGLTTGKTYKFTVVVTTLTGGSIQIQTNGNAFTISSPGTYTFHQKPASLDGPYVTVTSGTVSASITLLDYAEVIGQHATQSAVASKPTVQRISGRNVISFDGNNDVLQTSVPSGPEGYFAAGVTVANHTSNQTLFGNGAGDASIKGVWMAKGAGASTYTLNISDGSGGLRDALVSPTVPLNTPCVVGAGWDATSMRASVDTAETAMVKTKNPTHTAGFALGGLYSFFHSGSAHAIVYTPVLPDAATRKVIRDGIAALQGRTL